MSSKWYRVLLIAISVLSVVLVAFLVGGQTEASGKSINKEMKKRIIASGEDYASEALEAIQEAESSRAQAIEDSIEASIDESLSVMQSEAESLNAVVQSVAASIAEKEAERHSVEASIEASIAESVEAENAAALLASIEEERVNQQRELEEAQLKASQAIAELQQAKEDAGQEVPQYTSGVTILVGDSRTSGFEVYGLWPASQVFYMLDQVEAHYDILPQAANQNPTNIIFSNGVDDILCNGLPGACDQYRAFIKAFEELSPNTHIYVQAVLPCTEDGFKRFPVLLEIPTYNAMLANMCAENGWTYIDCSAGFDASYVGTDGIHFDSNWTRMWLNNMRMTVGF